MYLRILTVMTLEYYSIKIESFFFIEEIFYLLYKKNIINFILKHADLKNNLSGLCNGIEAAEAFIAFDQMLMYVREYVLLYICMIENCGWFENRLLIVFMIFEYMMR